MFLAPLFFSLGVSAAEYSFSLDEIGERAASRGWDELMSALPDDVRDELSDFSPSSDYTEVAESLKEKSDISYWLSSVISAIKASFPDALGALVLMLSVILFTAVAKGSVGAIATAEMSESFMFTMRLVGALCVIGVMSSALTVASTYIQRLCSIMNLIVPIMEGLYIAGGSLTEMSVMTQGTALFVTVIGNVNAHILTPLTAVLTTLQAVSSVCTEAKMGGFISGVRRLVMRVWHITVIFFSFMLGAQNVISSYADSLGSKTVKFALGSFIPIAGGVIAEAYGTVRGGLMFIKSATGIGGLIVILLILIPGILPIAMYKLSLEVGVCVAEMLSVSEMSDLLEGMRGVVELLLAIVLYTSLMFIFVLILFAKTGVA